MKGQSEGEPARSLWDKEALAVVRSEPGSWIHQRGVGAKPEAVGTAVSHLWERQRSPAKGLHRNEASLPQVPGGAHKAEQQAFISWEGAGGQCGEAWSRILCPSGLPQSHKGIWQTLEDLEARALLFSSPHRGPTKLIFCKMPCGGSEALSYSYLVLEWTKSG